MITINDRGEIRELRLNRPPANALSPELITALRKAFESAPQDGARALVLSGAPGIFSGGLDVPRLLTLDPHGIADVWLDFYDLLRAMAISPIPLVAAITGHAPAGGTVLALFCDRRIAAEGEWKIGLNEVQVGLMLPPVIFAALRRVVGVREAERLGVGGLLVSPSEAAKVGLVDEVVPPDSVVERAFEWCRFILSLPPRAMMATRRKARQDLMAIFEQDLKQEIQEVTASWWSDETQAVLRSLAERLTKKKA